MDKADFAKYAVVIIDKNGNARPLFKIATKEDVRKSINDFINNQALYDQPVKIIAAHKLNMAASIHNIALPDNFPKELLKEKYPDHTGANVLTIENIAQWDSELAAKQKALSSTSIKKVASDVKVFNIMDTYPVCDKETLKIAEEYFIENVDKADLEWRRLYASDLYKVANYYKEPLSDIVLKYAGEKVNPLFRDYMVKRSERMMDVELKNNKMNFKQNLALGEQLRKILGDKNIKHLIDDNFSYRTVTPLSDMYKLFTDLDIDKIPAEKLALAIQLLDTLAFELYQVNFTSSPLDFVYAPADQVVIQAKDPSVVINGIEYKPKDINWNKAKAILLPNVYTELKNDIRVLYDLPREVRAKILKGKA